MRTDLMRLREMTIRYRASRLPDGDPWLVGRTITTAADIAPALVARLQEEASEVFAILCLSTRCRAIAYYEVSRGTLDGTLVHPRDVFKAALLANASRILLVHNHPSGDPTPSVEDLRLTDRLVAGGQMLGVPVADHIVVGEGRCVSLRDRGRLFG